MLRRRWVWMALGLWLWPWLSAAVIPKSEQAAGFRLGAASLTLPLLDIHGFPFVRLQLEGRSGLFMVDTGSEAALTLNSHHFQLNQAKPVGQGFFGSGETFAIYQVARVGQIQLGPRQFDDVQSVTAQSAELLEGITPEFGGWIGYHFWGQGSLKLAYSRGQVSFYPAGQLSQALRGEDVVCALAFQTRSLINQPLVRLHLHGVELIAALDSGQYGSLYVSTPAARQQLRRWQQRGNLSMSGAQQISIDGLQLPCGKPLHLDEIDLQLHAFPAARVIGLSEPVVLTLGYGLLKQYDSVWDFAGHTMYLLTRHHQP